VPAGTCLSERASAGLGETECRIDVGGTERTSAAWVTGSPLQRGSAQVLFYLRPGRPGDRRRVGKASWPEEAGTEPELRVCALGGLSVDGPQGRLDGDWLGRKPGTLLKLLVCESYGAVTPERIAEALKPESGHGDVASRARYYVHGLRTKVEPERRGGDPPRLVVALPGGYGLDRSRVWIDSEEFQHRARIGLSAFAQGSLEPASRTLREALGLYRGEFLPHDRYEDWALEERERLYELVARVLRACVRIALQQGDLEGAADHARRLAAAEPLDGDVQEQLIEICLRRGRRSEALRRYDLLHRRSTATFGRGPGFNLAQVEARLAAEMPERG
jgi:DNA-binding SARP family transcriptional activator